MFELSSGTHQTLKGIEELRHVSVIVKSGSRQMSSDSVIIDQSTTTVKNISAQVIKAVNDIFGNIDGVTNRMMSLNGSVQNIIKKIVNLGQEASKFKTD